MYATLEDFQNSAPKKAFTSLSDELITIALSDASSIVDGFLYSSYVLPLTEPFDNVLKLITISLASYQLLLIRGFNPDNSIDQIIVDDKDKKMELLREIQSGKIVLSNIVNNSSNLRNQPKIFAPE